MKKIKTYYDELYGIHITHYLDNSELDMDISLDVVNNILSSIRDSVSDANLNEHNISTFKKTQNKLFDVKF